MTKTVTKPATVTKIVTKPATVTKTVTKPATVTKTVTKPATVTKTYLLEPEIAARTPALNTPMAGPSQSQLPSTSLETRLGKILHEYSTVVCAVKQGTALHDAVQTNLGVTMPTLAKRRTIAEALLIDK